MAGALKSRNDHTLAMVLFSGAFLAGLYRVMRDIPAAGVGHEVLAVAASIARNGAFADPFAAARTGPTAILPPLYPAYVALLMKIGGDQFYFGMLLVVSAVLVFAIHASILPAVSEVLLGVRRPGMYAALLSIAAFQIIVAREPLYLATGLMLFCLLAARVLRGPRGPVAKGAALGAACGVLALLNPAAILICPAVVAFLALRSRQDFRPLLKLGAVFAAACVLVCLPWSIRNYRQLGEFVMIRSNLGLELSVANNDCASPNLRSNRGNGCHGATHPNANPQEALLLKQMGESAYNRRKFAEAVDWIAANPGRFLRLTAARAVLFWFPEATPAFAPYAYTIWFATAVSLLGMFRLARRGAPAAWFLAAVSIVYSGLYFVVQADICYRYPILWISLLGAGCFLSELLDPLGARALALARPSPAPATRPLSARARTES